MQLPVKKHDPDVGWGCRFAGVYLLGAIGGFIVMVASQPYPFSYDQLVLAFMMWVGLFPAGLSALFGFQGHPFSLEGLALLAFWYLVYAVMAVTGIKRRSWLLLALFGAMVVLSIKGCVVSWPRSAIAP